MPDRYYIGGQKPYPTRRTSGRAPTGGWSRRPPLSRPSWRKWLRIAGWLLLAAAIVAALGGLIAYRALKHVPEFYRQAMEVSLDEHAVAGDRMVKQVAGLASDVQKEGRWTAVFTAEELNGWLAVELGKKRPGLLPPNLSDPRVSIKPDGVTVACRYRSGAWDSVVSLAVDLYPAEPDVVAVQVRGVWAGNLPLPLRRILDEISQATNRLEWRVDWRRSGDDPVALVSIPRPQKAGEKRVRIEAVKLEEGRIRLAGTSQTP